MSVPVDSVLQSVDALPSQSFSHPLGEFGILVDAGGDFQPLEVWHSPVDEGEFVRLALLLSFLQLL